MKIMWLANVIVGICIGFCACDSKSETNNQEATTSVDGIINDVTSQRIERVELLLAPQNLATRIAIDEQSLEKISVKITITNLSRDNHLLQLLKALKEVSVDSESRKLDLRYGCLFFNSKGLETHRLYVDHFRKYGKLDGKPVVFPIEMVDWINTIKQACGRNVTATHPLEVVYHGPVSLANAAPRRPRSVAAALAMARRTCLRRQEMAVDNHSLRTDDVRA